MIIEVILIVWQAINEEVVVWRAVSLTKLTGK